MRPTRTARQAWTDPARCGEVGGVGGHASVVWWVVMAAVFVLGGASSARAQVGVAEAAVAAAAALDAAPVHPEPQEREDHAEDEEHDDSRITDEYIPLFVDGFPQRPRPLIEIGQPFLGTGNIGSGFTIPGGAVWTPSFVAFGTYRGGLSTIDAGGGRTSQWANRLDFFGNLALTGSERFVFGLRPLDETVEGQRLFSGYINSTPGDGEFVDRLNFDWNTVSHLFFEGDFGELFPGLDDDDRRGLDFGFSVGRQPISFQEGLLINDSIDGVGTTRNNFKPGSATNLRFTGLYSWNEVNRNTPSADGATRNVRAESGHLVGGFTEIDWEPMTVAIDVIYVRGGRFVGPDARVLAGDGLYAGVSFVGRPGAGFFNTAVRVVTSVPLGDQTPEDNPLDISDPDQPWHAGVRRDVVDTAPHEQLLLRQRVLRGRGLSGGGARPDRARSARPRRDPVRGAGAGQRPGCPVAHRQRRPGRHVRASAVLRGTRFSATGRARGGRPVFDPGLPGRLIGVRSASGRRRGPVSDRRRPARCHPGRWVRRAGIVSWDGGRGRR